MPCGEQWKYVGISTSIDLNFNKLIFEGDTQVIINAVNDEKKELSYYRSVIEDAKELSYYRSIIEDAKKLLKRKSD